MARLARLPMIDGPAQLPFTPRASDRRFTEPAWARAPFVYWQQAFLAQAEWWQSATREIRGMRPRDAERARFTATQLLDIWSPSNSPWLNPAILERTIEEAGANLVRGATYLVDDDHACDNAAAGTGGRSISCR